MSQHSPRPGSRPRLRWSRYHQIFVPVLAGATLRDRLVACAGALLGIMLTGLLCRNLVSAGELMPLLVAPIGASAVLLFAVPASPLAQPWSIIGGNMVSALVGVLVARIVPDVAFAAGLAVALAIAAMSVLRCIHPPGGAAALTAVIGGPVVVEQGLVFPFVPVGLNSLLLVAAGLLFHRLSGHSYPHRPAPAPALLPDEAPGFVMEDVDRALEDLGETFDIAREDIDRLLRQVEQRAEIRRRG